jgi:FAD/FMN-containing dehydrogenase
MSDINSLQSLFGSILSPDRILADQASLTHYGRDWLKDYKPAPALVVLPEKITELQALVKLCAERKIAIVPSGGRTGLSGGATATNGEVVVSLERMRSILEINRVDRTARCQAGVTIEQLQLAAAEQGLYFPVDFSSRGSAQVGGAIATNAGGIRVIKYGNIRDSVLGLTVITGSGEILNLNGSLFKNNSGYDLRNLFIGSEGTLGIIVEATLTLASPPNEIVRALCGLASIDDLLPLLTYSRDKLPNLSAFECMERLPFAEVVTHRGLRDPLSQAYPAYALIECELASSQDREGVTNTLAEAYERGLVQDIVVSESTAQANELMNLRDYISETMSQHYTIHKNDISVPISAIPVFLNDLHRSLKSAYPTFQVAVFGHVGDGNLHVNVLKPSSMEDKDFFEQCRQADHIVFQCVATHSGSVSAEHGVGLLKRDFIHYTRSQAEIECMRGIKRVFDPSGIMNPGKVIKPSIIHF